MSLWTGTVIAAVFLSSGIVAAQHTGSSTQQAPFRSSLDLVTFHVTVTDPSGGYVENVKPDELIVLENGRPQELAVFQAGGLPLAVTILIDGSSSMRPDYPAVQRAAGRFIEQLEPGDIGSVVAFGSTVRVLQDFTDDRATLEAAVRTPPTGGQTALYNALYIALKELEKTARADAAPRRRVAVVLSDGEDTSSLVGLQELLESAARSDTAIYSIRLKPTEDDRNPRSAQSVLRQLAEHSGGRAFVSPDTWQLSRVYEQIRTELDRQYAVGYVSRDARKDGAFRRIAVQVLRAGTRARTKVGYFAPADARSR